MPSLGVQPGDRAALFTCFGGCARPLVLATLRDRLGYGLGPLLPRSAPPPVARPTAVPFAAVIERLWSKAIPDHPRLRAYLQFRGLSGAVPPALRLHPACLYLEVGQPRRWLPAMLARFVRPDGSVTGLHRMYLDPNGPGKAAVPTPKKFLGRVAGSSIQLAEGVETALAVAEGVETALAVAEARGGPVWAAGSAGGLAVMELPPGLHLLEIWSDPDPAGRAAAGRLAARAQRRGIRVELFIPRRLGA
ncbi:MAG: DUF7146 domain-containing protein [Candidatus Dormibacteria bacterium]